MTAIRPAAAPRAAVPRRYQAESRDSLQRRLATALDAADGPLAAELIHERWMRGEIGINIERALERLWAVARGSVPDWLPMRYVEWLPLAYEVAARCVAARRGRSNLYLVLLDYHDAAGDPYGVYVGMTGYAPALRFDQHKAGIRSAGSVLKRGLELLSGPTLHLQGIGRDDAERIEAELAEALRAAGLRVHGGH